MLSFLCRLCGSLQNTYRTTCDVFVVNIGSKESTIKRLVKRLVETGFVEFSRLRRER